MSQYIMNLGTVMMLCGVAGILIPEGGIKKFASLAMGFIIIASAIVPVGDAISKLTLPDFSFETDEESFFQAESTYREEVLKKHCENLEKEIYGHIKNGSSVSVKVDDDGNIESVNIMLKGDESAAVAYIVQTLKVPRERIKTSYENN